jgi:hypothetical protein
MKCEIFLFLLLAAVIGLSGAQPPAEPIRPPTASSWMKTAYGELWKVPQGPTFRVRINQGVDLLELLSNFGWAVVATDDRADALKGFAASMAEVMSDTPAEGWVATPYGELWRPADGPPLRVLSSKEGAALSMFGPTGWAELATEKEGPEAVNRLKEYAAILAANGD